MVIDSFSLKKTGILLLNLGTPANYDEKNVRRFLREFLNDPFVVNLPQMIRWVLVNFLIIPLRVKKSAHAYKSIWQEEGSPLLVNSLRLKSALSDRLGESYRVALGMRYGEPSLTEALNELKTCRRIVILPLFPQYAQAVTGSILDKALSLISSWKVIPSFSVKSSFYQDPDFVKVYAQLIKKTVEKKAIDLFLFSYHGLPERQIDKKQCISGCDHQLACPIQGLSDSSCYRAQCYMTSNQLAKALGLSDHQYTTAFQSRLGLTAWIKPYADHLLPELVSRGIKNIAVVCPSFVADCLETLEEINIRMREQWKHLSGGQFILVPSLNDDPLWIETLTKLGFSD